ncbi:MAG: hypothetical protein Q4C87_00950 [Actinomycetaceae bacterium]|nr:hypothetical protein [Actinomycetaceae bacterium]
MSGTTDSYLSTLIQRFPAVDEPIYGEGPTYFGDLGEWDFPADYLAFLKAYGEGRIWDYITLLSPFTPAPHRNSFAYRGENLNYALQGHLWTEDMPDCIDSYANLYPWADSDVADTFFWMWTNKEEGEYVVVLHNPKNIIWEVHNLTITEFLYRLWDGTLNSKEYYPGRLYGDDYFVSARDYSMPTDILPYNSIKQTVLHNAGSSGSFMTHLQSLCPPPATPVLWDNKIRFSEFLPHALSADYLELASTYGDGAFNDLITLYSPYCLIRERNYFTLNQLRLLRLENKRDEPTPPPFPCALNDLHQWARSDNQDSFYWMWTDESAGEYAIVVHNQTEEIPWEIHHLTFTEFLYQLLSGTLKTEMVSLICIDPPASFTPIYTNDDFLRQR